MTGIETKLAEAGWQMDEIKKAVMYITDKVNIIGLWLCDFDDDPEAKAHYEGIMSMANDDPYEFLAMCDYMFPEDPGLGLK